MRQVGTADSRVWERSESPPTSAKQGPGRKKLRQYHQSRALGHRRRRCWGSGKERYDVRGLWVIISVMWVGFIAIAMLVTVFDDLWSGGLGKKTVLELITNAVLASPGVVALLFLTERRREVAESAPDDVNDLKDSE